MPKLPSSGRRVRIAVIDSGVNAAHPHITAVAGGVTITPDGEIQQGYLDTLGHGTAVMAAIQHHTPDAEYYAVKVFHESLKTALRSLLLALEWSIGERMDLINLSLGTRNSAHEPFFAPFIEEAVGGNITVVSARGEGDELYYPGCMNGVAGVALDSHCPENEYRLREGIYYASGYPRAAPGIPRERNLRGISFAVANVTGLLAVKRSAPAP